MNILISYSTNSGSTFVVARTVAKHLEQSYSVALKPASLTSEQDAKRADIIFLGSPSWDMNGKEGQPHETMISLLNKLSKISLDKKRFFLFGCGDSSYTYFCGAVDELEKWVKTTDGILVLPSLRLDEFFFHEKENLQKVQTWIEHVDKHHLKK